MLGRTMTACWHRSGSVRRPFLSPTIGFAIGMLLYGEKLSKVEWVTFACVWTALALYSASSLLASRETGRKGAVS